MTGKTFWLASHDPKFNLSALLVEIMVQPIPPASVRARELGSSGTLPPGFDAWFELCLEREQDRRFADADEAIAALERVLGASPLPTPAQPAVPRARSVVVAPTEPLALRPTVPLRDSASGAATPPDSGAPARRATDRGPGRAATSLRKPSPRTLGALAVLGVGAVAFAAAVAWAAWVYSTREEERPPPSVTDRGSASVPSEPAGPPTVAELRQAPPSTERVAPAPPPPSVPPGAVRDPFEDPLPEPMTSLHAHVARGRSLSRSQVRQVRSWARENGDDVRANLLLGHSYMNERALSYALPEYEAAMARDRTVCGYPEMLPDLLEMAVSHGTARRASDRIVEWYGAEAVPAIDAALRGLLRAEEEQHLRALRTRAAAAR